MVGRVFPIAFFASSLLFVSTAFPQSMLRMQAPGGRQHLSDLNINAITNGEQFLLCSVPDGFIPGDNNGFENVAWYDMWTGSYSFAVTGVGGAPLDQDCSGIEVSGEVYTPTRFVLFDSRATNLGPPHQNGMTDVFLLDRQSGIVSRASLTAAGGEPDNHSTAGELSDDGRFVVFSTEASGMVPGDVNGMEDVFVRDMVAGATEIVSISLTGSAGNDSSNAGEISEDGRYVAFLSLASDLVIGDTNQAQDLFLRDRQTATTERLNLGPNALQSNGQTISYSMNRSAEYVVFDTTATNLLSQPVGSWEVYILDRRFDTLRLGSVGSNGQVANGISYDPQISDDGGWVLLTSEASNLVGNDFDTDADAYLIDLGPNNIELVSRSTGGSPGVPPAGQSSLLNTGTVSFTGRYSVIYTNLEGLVAGDTNLGEDTFLWNGANGAGPIESYCTSKLNSLGCTPRVSSGGDVRSSGPEDAFFISAHDMRNNKPGLFLWSLSPAALPFAGGTLCLGTPTTRTDGQMSGGTTGGNDCSGTFSYHMTQAYMQQHGLTNGTTAYGQFWGRDPGFAPPDAVTLSDGIVFTVGP